MQSRVTKAGSNRYCQARLKAAKYNEKLLTRAGAVDYLPAGTHNHGIERKQQVREHVGG